MIEAMACGTPPIAFNRGAASEIICHRETGFLVPGLEEMVEMMDRVDEIDPVACRAAVQARFSPAALADRYLAVYAKILGCDS
jgi:glycosyltransferase involved in cell wall biosynthesis